MGEGGVRCGGGGVRCEGGMRCGEGGMDCRALGWECSIVLKATGFCEVRMWQKALTVLGLPNFEASTSSDRLLAIAAQMIIHVTSAWPSHTSLE